MARRSKQRDKPAPPEPAHEMWFHPQRGVLVIDRPMQSEWLRYRGGEDKDWRYLREVSYALGDDGRQHLVKDRALPAGFLWADPSKQVHGMGGPYLAYGPLERSCRDCKRDFVFAAAEQQHWYEELGFIVDAKAVRCVACRRSRHRVEAKRRAYELAVRAATATLTAETQLAYARAALAFLDAGGRAPFDRAIAAARRARRLGARGTEAVEAALIERRDRPSG